MWNLPNKTSITRYTALVTAMLFGWLLEMDYWLYQTETNDMSSFWFDDFDVAWWYISLVTIDCEILYFIFLSSFSTNCKIARLSSSILVFLSQLMCMTDIYLSVSVLIFYWLSKLLIGMIFIKIFMYWNESDLQVTSDNMSKELFMLFITVIVSMIVLVDFLLYDSGLKYAKYLNWFVIVCFGLFLQLLHNLVIPFIVNKVNETIANDDWLSNWFQKTIILVFYFEADISLCLKYVMLSAVYIGLSEVWDKTHAQWFIDLDNSGETNIALACLRRFSFAAIVTIITTLLTVNLAAYIQVNVWLLLIATGNAVLLWRAFGTFVDALITVFAPNSTERDIERRDKILIYVFVVRYALEIVVNGIHRCCQLFLPCFQEVFYTLILIVFYDAGKTNGMLIALIRTVQRH